MKFRQNPFVKFNEILQNLNFILSNFVFCKITKKKHFVATLAPTKPHTPNSPKLENPQRSPSQEGRRKDFVDLLAL